MSSHLNLQTLQEPHQHVFPSRPPLLSTLQSLIAEVIHVIDEGITIYVACPDFDKACDCVSHGLLLVQNKIFSYGMG